MINEVAREAHQNSVNHHFWDAYPTHADKLKTIGEKVALIHSEASEAFECYRDNDMHTTINMQSDPPGKPEGFPSELADIVIRVFDLSVALGIDIEREIAIKMAYNVTRPIMHGKVC